MHNAAMAAPHGRRIGQRCKPSCPCNSATRHARASRRHRRGSPMDSSTLPSRHTASSSRYRFLNRTIAASRRSSLMMPLHHCLNASTLGGPPALAYSLVLLGCGGRWRRRWQRRTAVVMDCGVVERARSSWQPQGMSSYIRQRSQQQMTRAQTQKEPWKLVRWPCLVLDPLKPPQNPLSRQGGASLLVVQLAVATYHSSCPCPSSSIHLCTPRDGGPCGGGPEQRGRAAGAGAARAQQAGDI